MSAAETSGTRSRDGILVPLTSRLRWLLIVRLVLLTIPVLIAQAAPQFAHRGVLGHPESAALYLLIPAYSTLLLQALLAVGTNQRSRRTTRLVLTTGLLTDGVILTWAFCVLGGTRGPVPYLMVVYAVAVTLLASFPTGLKLALWQTLLLAGIQQFANVHAGVVASFGALDSGSVQYNLMYAALWATTIGTACFAAANERELRRRRYEAEALANLDRELQEAADRDQILAVLVSTLVNRMGVRQALAVWIPGGPSGALISQGNLGLRALTEADRLAEMLALEDSGVRLLTQPDGVMADLLGGAAHLVALPLQTDRPDQGLVVFEPTPSWVNWGSKVPPVVHRSLLEFVSAAAVRTALALERDSLVSQLQLAASSDMLTGLMNRRALDDYLAEAFAAARSARSPLSVCLLDLDHFKLINDTHGHQVGDEVLRLAGAALAQASAGIGVAARYGGEEFALVLPLPEPQALAVAERVRQRVQAINGPAAVTASIGVATLAAADGRDRVAALLADADAALYAAKDGGRNQVRVYRRTTGSVPAPRADVESAVHGSPTGGVDLPKGFLP
jgi:two-component system cell cycle response regulator